MSGRSPRPAHLLALLTSIALVGLAPTTPAAGAAGASGAAGAVGSAGAAPSVTSACESSSHAGTSARGSGDRPADTEAFTAAELRTVERELKRAGDGRSRFAMRTDGPVEVDVHVHVIAGDAVRGPKRKRVARQMNKLATAYAGGQSIESADAGFVFRQVSFERVRNDRWHRARLGGSADRAMRRKLHRGGVDALNVYILAPRPQRGSGPGTLLGWSSMPWSAQSSPRQDGISLHYDAMPGGRFDHYNEGDTLVHEAGHWLGLLHTFEGGCSETNDYVADTPAQKSPTDGCPEGANTCPDPIGVIGLDPIHNFMDYSFDSCMNMFTAGQVERMNDAWTTYRTRAT